MNDERFRSCIQFYKRFIDDVIWTGPVATLCEFRKAMGKADPNISLDCQWTGYDSQEAATDPTVVKEREHGQVHFMDLDMWDHCGSNTFRLHLGQTPILECCSGRTVNLAMPTRTSPSIPSTVDMSQASEMDHR